MVRSDSILENPHGRLEHRHCFLGSSCLNQQLSKIVACQRGIGRICPEEPFIHRQGSAVATLCLRAIATRGQCGAQVVQGRPTSSCSGPKTRSKTASALL